MRAKLLWVVRTCSGRGARGEFRFFGRGSEENKKGSGLLEWKSLRDAPR